MYTTVKELNGAIGAAIRLAERGNGSRPVTSGRTGSTSLARLLPLLVDQVMAESGIIEAAVAARAIEQADGDTSRAVSLVRAWGACLPRFGRSRVTLATDLEVSRRITPALQRPEGGQYLGASRDFLPRLLDLDSDDSSTAPGPGPNDGMDRQAPEGATPALFPRAAEPLESEGVIAAPHPVAAPLDRTRTAAGAGHGRGAFLQALARAETGAMTAVAYTGVRGDGGGGGDPTLMELRAGSVPVRVTHPSSGRPFVVGRMEVTTAETALYRMSRGDADQSVTDSRFTLGVGVTVGSLERRAIAASFLDARVARSCGDPAGTAQVPADDEEWMLLALDGQEATGFVEHLKLPHHVTFSSDLDRVRAVAAGQDPALPLSDEEHS